jgi:hypothetical protein
VLLLVEGSRSTTPPQPRAAGSKPAPAISIPHHVSALFARSPGACSLEHMTMTPFDQQRLGNPRASAANSRLVVLRSRPSEAMPAGNACMRMDIGIVWSDHIAGRCAPERRSGDVPRVEAHTAVILDAGCSFRPQPPADGRCIRCT